jgi:hypothetical protein
MRVGAGMPQMICQHLEILRLQIVLLTLRRVVQLIERQPGLVGEIALPQSMASQERQSATLSSLGQLENARVRPQVPGRFQLSNEAQGRLRREAKPAPDFRERRRPAFVSGAANLLERIFPKDSSASPSPRPSEDGESDQEQDSESQP